MDEKIERENHIIIREMTEDDISLGMRLKSSSGWNQLKADWEMFCGAGGRNFVASLNGKDVGTVTSIPYDDHFAWIGMVLVDPAARRQGIGTALLKKALDENKSTGPLRLDATADGYELYKTLGFYKEYELVRMTRNAGKLDKVKEYVCFQMEKEDLPAVIDYDSPVFGANRTYILKSFFDRNPEYAFKIKAVGAINGYCLGRSGSNYEQIGPLVADNEEYARDLLLGILQKCAMKDIIIDAFVDKPEWISFLTKTGFIKQRYFIRMCLGALKHTGKTSCQYAIAGPETG